MNLADLNALATSYKNHKRRGRGHGSGLGKTAGRGHKGQKSRSGFSFRPHFEGGQQPLFRRIPKRGFNNINFKISYDLINLEDLNRFEAGSTVDHASLVACGFLKSRHGRLKVLARGELKHKITVNASKFSAVAKQSIEKLGGEAKEV